MLQKFTEKISSKQSLEKDIIKFKRKRPVDSKGCLMLYYYSPEWYYILDHIDDDDLWVESDPGGKEVSPHMTLLYGFDSKKVDPYQIIKDAMEYSEYFDKAKISKVNGFKNENTDVLKYEMSVPKELRKLVAELQKYPNYNKYPDWSPHMTIAYLNSGELSKYTDLPIPEIKLMSLVYSDERQVFIKHL